MTNIEQNLLLFDDLSASEQAEAEAYLREHPEAQSLVEEGQVLRGLLASQEIANVDMEDVADYVVSRRFIHNDPRLNRVGDAIQAHPELAKAVATIESNLARIIVGAEDPIAQFERLSGHSLSADTTAKVAKDRPAERRAPQMRLVRRPMRLALAACVAFVGLYSALWIVGSGIQAEHLRMADLDGVSELYEGPRFRGETESGDVAQYEAAMLLLHEARTSTVGLFPSYDESKLADAVSAIHAVANPDGEATYVSMEAQYVLARIYVYQERYEDAAQLLGSLVDQAGPRAPDAQRLLDYIGNR